MDYCLTERELAFLFGLLGNVVSFMVFLAPLPTVVNICKKKCSDGFQSIPYTVGLSSATLFLYYGILKTNATMIISINSVGCVIEITYLVIYMIYGSKQTKMLTLKTILLMNVGSVGIILGVTMWILKGPERVYAVGWICATFNIAAFVAPLVNMRKVIRTKSVKLLPFTLSVVLTMSASMWFFYGLFVHDMYMALPNILGFLLGMTQMILNAMYKDANKTIPADQVNLGDMKSTTHITNT